jgi:hypothetical protein
MTVRLGPILGDVPQRILRLLGICFLRGALEGAVEGSGDGEKGGYSIHPDTVSVHLANHTGTDIGIRRCRLWLPVEGADFLALLPQPWLNALDPFPQNGIVTKGDKGGFVAKTDPLPLTYTAIEVECARADETSFSLWAYLRIKREVFDLSGGWVASDVEGKNTLTMLPYLKTLKRMHTALGHLKDVRPQWSPESQRDERAQQWCSLQCQGFRLTPPPAASG